MEIERNVVELMIDDVLPNRLQPRIKFDEDAIRELSESIKEHGVIQPIIVRRLGDKYEIIAGERRYKASVMAGKETIPAIIANLDDRQSAEIALIENVQRKDLTPIEEAISYQRILDMGYITQDQLALKVDKSQPFIANKLRLLNLDDEVQQALMNNKISERHARSLLKIKDNEKQVAMLNRIINERLTVRRTDEEISKLLNDSNNTENDSTPDEKKIENDDFEEIKIEEESKMNEQNQSLESTLSKPSNEINIQNLNMPTDPIIENEPIFNNPSSINPGFMDIDKIEQEAQDINVEKDIPDINSLLKNENEPTILEEIKPQPQEEITPTPPVKKGRFFNNLEDEEVNMSFEEPTPTSVTSPNIGINAGSIDMFNMYNNQNPNISESTTALNSEQTAVAPVEISTQMIYPEAPTVNEPIVPAESIIESPSIESEDTSMPIDIPITLDNVVSTPSIESSPSADIPITIEPQPQEEIVALDELNPGSPIMSELPTLTPEQSITSASMGNVNKEMNNNTSTVDSENTVEIKTLDELYGNIPNMNFNQPEELTSPTPAIESAPMNTEIETLIANAKQPLTTPVYDFEDIYDTMSSPGVTSSSNSVSTPTTSENEEVIEAPAKPILRNAISGVREYIETLENQGFVIELEEFDFENMYQIVVKINK